MAFPFVCETDIDYLCCLLSLSSITFHIPKKFYFHVLSSQILHMRITDIFFEGLDYFTKHSNLCFLPNGTLFFLNENVFITNIYHKLFLYSAIDVT